MSYGHWGKVLRVNLTTGAITTEEMDEAFQRRYVGGWGFIAHYLLAELAPGIDPLGPENKLIWPPGPLTGQAVAGGGRNIIGGKSPLTGGFGAAEAGGFFAAEFKRAGFDTVIVDGVSPKPVYLWIKDGQAELRDASHLWGRETADVEAAIREELGDKRIRVSQCGPAGEKMVRFANVIHDSCRAAGRTGLGAVMGSKRFRAIAVRGSKAPDVADPDKIREMAHWMRDHYMETGAAVFSTLGTMRMIRVNNGVGGLPTRNFRDGVFEGYEKISAEVQMDTITVDRDTCFGCPIRCKWVVEVKDDQYPVERKYGGPEYETVGAFGSCCGVDDIKVTAYASQLCNANGLDSIGAGVTISCAMECYEHGLLTQADTDGIDLRFGNGEAVIAALKKIIAREGFGNLLAEGSKRLTDKIGGDAPKYAMQVKGQEIAMHDPRTKYGHALGVAVSPTGADHMHSVHDTAYQTKAGVAILEPVGIHEPLPWDDLSLDKVRMVRYAIMWRVGMNMTGVCMFHPWTPQQTMDLIAAATGWNTSVMDLWLAGERAYDMARAFNAREGFGPEDDWLPERFFTGVAEGPVAGRGLNRERFAQAIQEWYALNGYDPRTACPTRAKLQDLGVGWVADKVEEAKGCKSLDL